MAKKGKVRGKGSKKRKIKKPIYTRWWFILIAVIFVFGIFGSLGKDDKEKSETKKDKTELSTKESKEEKKPVIPLELDSLESATDAEGTATITGKTEAGAKIQIGWGVLNDSVLADESGNFSIIYKHSGTKDKIIEITSSLDGSKSSKNVTIKPSAEYLASLEAIESEAKEEDNSNDTDSTIPADHKSALKQAGSYSKRMNMSKTGIYNQLVSEYGGKFSAEAAQYAVDNVQADWNANALKKAENYANNMHLSKIGVYDQLISEYGENFTPEEAQYAIDTIQIDWNANALEKAKSYQDKMAMSPDAIRDQLTSEYGEKFTPEEAEFAIQHLNE